MYLWIMIMMKTFVVDEDDDGDAFGEGDIR